MKEIEEIVKNKPVQDLDWGRFVVDKIGAL